MPEGSSSAAPVINPGPRFEKNLRKRPCRTSTRLATLAAGVCRLNAGTVVFLRRETNLLPGILAESPGLARSYKRVPRFRARWLRRRLRFGDAWFPDAALARASKLDWRAQAPAWSFRVRSGDLLVHGARRRQNGRVRHRHDARRLSVVIRALLCLRTHGAFHRAASHTGRS